MATWGEFMNEVRVIRLKPGEMYVKVDDAITLWEERQQLRAEVERLRAALAGEREACAQEVEEFAQACAEESGDAEFVASALRMVANLIRERDEPEAAEEPSAAPAPEPASEPEHGIGPESA